MTQIITSWSGCALLVSVMLLGFAVDLVNAEHYPSALPEWVSRSGFIFRGTVEAPQATAIPGALEPLDRYVVVRADEIIRPKQFSLATRKLTVQTTHAQPFRVGYQGYFFTNVAVLGEPVVVVEVGHLDATGHPGLPAHVEKIQRFLSEFALYRRAAGSAVVAVGEVQDDDVAVSVGATRSEHDPMWHEVTVKILETIHGIPVESVRVRYSASADVSHYRKPKLRAGQRGVFLLKEDQMTHAPADAFLVVDPNDVQTMGDLPHVRALLKHPPKLPRD